MKKINLDSIKNTYRNHSMLREIQIALDLKEELDNYRPLDAEVESRIMQKFKLDWNYHSNNIEGNALTYGETKALILHGITAQGKSLKDHFEITGHNEAIEWILDVVKGERPLTESFIRQFHKILLKEPYEADAITPDGRPTKKMIQVGEYKSSPNHVKTKTGEIFYFASVEETPALMKELIDWYRSKKDELNPIILASEFHYRFIRIHPFDDGNGRVARLIMNFILIDNDYPPVIIKTEDKENYFSVLRQADSGAIEPFLTYIAENLVASLKLMISGAKGEDIYDAKDALKEFRLLQTEISSKASFNKKDEEKRSELINKYVSNTVFPILERINKSLIPQTGTMLDELNVTRRLFNSTGDEKGRDENIDEGSMLDQGSMLASIREGKFDSFSFELVWRKIKDLPELEVKVIIAISMEVLETGVSIHFAPSQPDFSETILESFKGIVSNEFIEKLHSKLLHSITDQVKKFI